MEISSYEALQEAEKSLKTVATKLAKKQKTLVSKKKEIEKIEKEIAELEQELNNFFSKKEEPRERAVQY